jgi:four helix bundle protein
MREEGGSGGTFRDEVAWQRAMDLTMAIFKTTEGWDAHDLESFRLQLRNAGFTVASKIAVAHDQGSDLALNFLSLASQALIEIEILLDVSKEMGYLGKIAADRLTLLCQDVQETLDRLIDAKTNRT